MYMDIWHAFDQGISGTHWYAMADAVSFANLYWEHLQLTCTLPQLLHASGGSQQFHPPVLYCNKSLCTDLQCIWRNISGNLLTPLNDGNQRADDQSCPGVGPIGP